jgi:hypothetical protein
VSIKPGQDHFGAGLHPRTPRISALQRVGQGLRPCAMLAFPRPDRRLSHGNLPRLQRSTQHRVALTLPLLWPPFAPCALAFARTDVRRCLHAGSRRSHNASPSGTQRDLPRSDAPLSLRAVRTHGVSECAPQKSPSPQGCKLGSARRGRPVRLAFAFGYGPEIRRKPFGFHLTIDTLPSSCHTTRGRRDLPGLCEGRGRPAEDAR